MKKRALVIGLKISGKGAVRLLCLHNYEVIGADRDLSNCCHLGIPLIVDTSPLPDLPFKLIVLSPGIPTNHPLCLEAKQRGIEVIGEAELAFRYLSPRQKVIAVTGTNGKTTLALFLAAMLTKGGKQARALGNIGTSLADYACQPKKEEILVVELSSFQLETMQTRAIDYGIITAITPDHLDRYASFEAYAQAKCRLSRLIRDRGKLLVTAEIATKYSSLFSSKTPIAIVNPVSCLQVTKKKGYWGNLDCEKIAFADAIARNFKIDAASLSATFASFSFPPHRIEHVGEVNGVAFVNDSKATNVAAVLFAVLAINRPIVLIAGGLDKGGDFSRWRLPFQKKVKCVVTIGKAAPLIKAAFDYDFRVVDAHTLDCAVHTAFKQAQRGELVLLSPGCASFDQFQSYEERGKKFTRLVSDLRRKYEQKRYDDCSGLD